MAVAANLKTERNAPVTVVYRDGAIPAQRPAPARPSPRRKAQPQPSTRVRRAPDPKLKLKLATIALVMISGIMAAALLAGYALVNSAHMDVNQMKQENAQVQLRLEELSTQIEQSVDFSAVREAALERGMGYPTAEQVAPVD
ncbi:MAG: hypothetical protein Q4B99_05525 [Clostridia bacterium]|nr:hypothetical protein [Clostridia bacterium]